MKVSNKQKEQVNQGFSEIYKTYEELSQTSLVDQYMRSCVYTHVNSLISPNSSLLELNCGSGIDAAYFAAQGHSVLATDIAQSSADYVALKKEQFDLKKLSFQYLDFEEIHKLKPQQFDYIFSNFGGFNCVSSPEYTFSQFKDILQPGGIVTLCVLSPYYPWEWLYALKGKFKLAFRRLKKGGTVANVEGKAVHTFYFTPKQIQQKMGMDFQLINVESLGFAFPSVNFEKVHQRRKLSKLLLKIDKKLHQWNLAPAAIGDYFVISFRWVN